ncbi:MAG: ParA family protein [Rhodothermales bacterium]|nr:ParA family protein [Rhodothermales bacterium]
MRHILVMNAKGGCGKSTLATNLAAYYAQEGYRTSLADFDPQRTSLDWLARRPGEYPEISGVPAFESGLRHLSRSTEYLIIDSPARAHGSEITELVRRAETVVIPVLPSPIDIAATSRFVEELKDVGRIQKRQVKIAVVANRVRENTKIFGELDEYLDSMKRTKYAAVLREAQNYNRAYAKGIGIHELPEYLAWKDWDRWDPLLKWLWSKRSQ